MFWENMSPDGGGAPSGDLTPRRIDSAFGSLCGLPGQVKETGVNQFGSGWSWLVHDGSGVAIVGSANQDNPISNGQTPLLGSTSGSTPTTSSTRTGRPDYIDAWWNVVNWDKVAERFAAAG